MPKTVTVDTSQERVDLWVMVNPDNLQITVSYTLEGVGVRMNKAVDMTSVVTAAERATILDFAKKLMAAAKAQEGV